MAVKLRVVMQGNVRVVMQGIVRVVMRGIVRVVCRELFDWLRTSCFSARNVLHGAC